MSENKNVFTLDALREAADRKYANVTIDIGNEHIVLVNAMQLPKEKRAELMATQKKLTAVKDALEEGEEDVEDVDQVEHLENTLRIVVRGGEDPANRLIHALDHNLALLATVFEKYTGETELGEASASASS